MILFDFSFLRYGTRSTVLKRGKKRTKVVVHLGGLLRFDLVESSIVTIRRQNVISESNRTPKRRGGGGE